MVVQNGGQFAQPLHLADGNPAENYKKYYDHNA
jgi:hypothetical protein